MKYNTNLAFLDINKKFNLFINVFTTELITIIPFIFYLHGLWFQSFVLFLPLFIPDGIVLIFNYVLRLIQINSIIQIRLINH